jgi:hypothetical protein
VYDTVISSPYPAGTLRVHGLCVCAGLCRQIISSPKPGRKQMVANPAGSRWWLGAVPYQLRTPEQIEGFFTGLTLVDPGVVPVPEWHPDPSPFPLARIDTLGGVGRKAAAGGAG